MKCSLCLQSEKLQESHIIPAFVFKWIKKTSATGYLRNWEDINKRVQDGLKLKLLCTNCEKLFNTHETKFANNIFYPYVNDELDDSGVAQGILKSVEYEDWLLNFTISLHWRLIATYLQGNNTISQEHDKTINEYYDKWRIFLIGERRDTGGTESHIVFLQNLAAATGEFPPNLNDKINFYILRATDGTIFYSRKDLGVYCKLGPIALLTFLKPNKLKDVNYTRIRLKGEIFTAQKISNPRIANFVFLTRPNEVMGNVSFSEKQQKVIEKSYLENYEKALESMTVKAFESDLILKKYKK